MDVGEVSRDQLGKIHFSVSSLHQDYFVFEMYIIPIGGSVVAI